MRIIKFAKKSLKTFMLCIGLLPIIAKAEFPQTDLDYMGLPIFCKEMHQEGAQGTPRALMWEKRLAGNGGIHHYCAGLFTYNLAWKTNNRAERMSYLKQAINEMVFPFKHGMVSDFVLIPKMYYDIGKAYEGLEDYKAAIDNYHKSIERSPKTWMPYAALGDIYIKLNRPNEAINILEQGLEKKPDSKPLLKRLSKLKKTQKAD
ncbi:tetratricopeptide repeat protein [Methylomonas sp. EFPC3]|uniref:tetratricopeptide repeat protein n=1 Tax=Methylomonas sp. EFPC3 TaxID=3021710 RepID=UPI002416A4E5|nr:tetratricopeptide repeat protein [Methylomonas sp. EFPC3]WFP51292.1 tetratricopeptide repeat protein [Methylomonas sp. EFPC3]